MFIHRWLGLISGLVVFIVSITGCIFCFQDEIQEALCSYRKVEVSAQPFLTPSQLEKAALKRLPEGKFNGIIYFDKSRSAQVRVTNKEGFHTLYMNPYTGQVLHDELLMQNFFVIIEYIHLYLLLPANIGRVVVGTAVLIFVALLITGIILWWPKRKTDRKRSLTIKWNGRWGRINYDLHNVLGFYASAIALILAVTGLSMSFTWVQNGIYNAANMGKSFAAEKAVFKSDSLLQKQTFALPAMDKAYRLLTQASPQAEMLLFYTDAQAGGVLYGVAYSKLLQYGYHDSYQFDQYNGRLLQYLPNRKKSTGQKLTDLNYDIHVGQVAGMPGKIVAFMASLICASLPVTGFLIWLGRRKKGKKSKLMGVTHKKSSYHLKTASVK